MGAELLCDANWNEVQRHLVGGVCVYNGEPVVVSRTEGHRVQVNYLKDPFLVETVDYRIKEFRYNSPPLGYFNGVEKTFYLKRSAADHSYHALRQQYIVVSPSDLHDELFSYSPDWFTSKAMSECIKGEHPSFKEVLEGIREEKFDSRAFHRHYALGWKARNTYSLVKRGNEEIGLVKGDKLIVFDDRHKPIIEKIIASGAEINVSSL